MIVYLLVMIVIDIYCLIPTLLDTLQSCSKNNKWYFIALLLKGDLF